MAKEFPKAKLTAMDMQNEIDSDNWPSNAEFILGDILNPNGKCHLLRICHTCVRLSYQQANQ